MKKLLLTFVLLVGVVFGLFAQQLTYQAVVRDNNQQLVTNTAVKATVTIDFFTGEDPTWTVEATTNIHGLLTFEFGGEALNGRDWTNATIAVKVVNAANQNIVYVNESPRPVSAVPYALSVNGTSIQQYLTENHYVTQTQVDATIHDSIAAIPAFTEQQVLSISNDTIYLTGGSYVKLPAGFSGDYNDLTNTPTIPTTVAQLSDAAIYLTTGAIDSLRNVQSDWNVTDATKDDFIKNKPTLFSGSYNDLTDKPTIPTKTSDLTNDAGYLTADSTVITNLQSDLAAAVGKEKTDSSTLAARIDALENASMDCDDVKNCIKDTLSKYTPTTDLCNVLSNCQFSDQSLAELLQTLTSQISDLQSQINAQNKKIDSLTNLPHGGDTPAAFVCGTSKVKDVQNNTYNTVKIGNQCWMKENMRCTVSPRDTSKSFVGQHSSEYYPRAFYYNNDTTNVATYGLLYNWTAAMDTTGFAKDYTNHRGICPQGWHIPSNADWDTLTSYVYSNAIYQCENCEGVWKAGGQVDCIAKAISSTDGWVQNDGSADCVPAISKDLNNATGFSAFPVGHYNGGFQNFGYTANFWSSTNNGSSKAFMRSLYYTDNYVGCYSETTGLAISVRCLRDTGIGGEPGNNETGGGTTPSTPGEVNCEQVMECMGDTLGKLNDKIVDLNATVTGQGTEIETLKGTVATQGGTITTQGQAIDSLAHIVDSLSNLPHGGDTPTDTFDCGTDKVKDAQNNEYNTVKIGDQCWTKENLRTRLGTVGDYGYPTGVSGTADTATYGRLYSWAAVMSGASASSDVPSGVRGICPEGWHVPSDGEWGNLINYVKGNTAYICDSGEDNIANALSNETGWTNSSTSGCNAGDNNGKRNQTGFSAVPAGYFDTSSTNKGTNAYFWSTTDSGSAVYYRHLDNTSSSMNSGFDFNKEIGLSVRCLRN